jgi:hypothetical protein
MNTFVSQAQNRSTHPESRLTEEDRKRIQLETLQRLRDMAGKCCGLLTMIYLC